MPDDRPFSHTPFPAHAVEKAILDAFSVNPLPQGDIRITLPLSVGDSKTLTVLCRRTSAHSVSFSDGGAAIAALRLRRGEDPSCLRMLERLLLRDARLQLVGGRLLTLRVYWQGSIRDYAIGLMCFLRYISTVSDLDLLLPPSPNP